MLEEDAAKFDAFLKDNDAAVQDAQRRADAETAARQLKVRAHSPADAPKQMPPRRAFLPSRNVLKYYHRRCSLHQVSNVGRRPPL